MVRTLMVCVFVMIAAAAYAQTPYVAGTIGADVARSSHSESNAGESTSGGSEVVSGSLRVGTSVGGNWGVEFEFVRSGETRQSGPVALPLLADRRLTSIATATTPTTVTLNGSTVALPIAFATDTRGSRSDYDAVAWVRQRVGGIDMIYLGGLAFSRQRTEITQTFPTVVGVFAPTPSPFRTTIIDYGTHPLVGAEARIGLTSHVKMIPGIRLQGLTGGWLLRPYVGLGWSF